MERLLCLSHLLALGGSSTVGDLVFNGCVDYGTLIDEGYLRLEGGDVYLTNAGRAALVGGLGRGTWWLVAVGDGEPCPLVKCWDVWVSPFSWELWEKVGGLFTEAYAVRGFRRCARVWLGCYGKRPYWLLSGARRLLLKALELYESGGNEVYAWRLFEEALEKARRACSLLEVECGGFSGGFAASAGRLLRVVEELLEGGYRRGLSSSQSCL